MEHPWLAALLASALASATATAQQPARSGPWDQDLWILESADGLEFGPPRRFVERAGVPSLARDAKDRLVAVFQWFPFDRPDAFDRVGVCFSEDGGTTWSTPATLAPAGFPARMERPYDPTLVPLEDGRLRVYFTSRDLDDPSDEQATWSAVSADGTQWTFEPEVRVRVRGERVIDCAAVRRGGAWHWFAPVQGQDGRGFHATSADGLAFERREDVRIDGRRAWLGNVVDTGDGFRFYGSGQGVWSAFSRDGAAWTLDPGTRAQGADPAVVRTATGRWFMVVTGGKRADAGRPLPAGIRGQGGGPGPGRESGGPATGAAASPGRGGASPGTALVAVGDRLVALVNGRLVWIDPETLKPVGELPLPTTGGGGPGFGPGGGRDEGPSGHRVLAARSTDGLTWAAEGNTLVEPASVPDAAVGPDGRTRIWFVDPQRGGISVGVEAADGSWSFERTNLRGADPNVLVLHDGTYRAFTKEGVQTARIVVAESADGVRFDAPQTALGDERYPDLTDADVFETPSGWVLYASLGPRLLLAESPDGKSFRAVRELDLGGSVSDTIAVEGGFRMYFHKNPDPQRGGTMAIWSAFSPDGREWQVEGPRLQASAKGPDRRGVGDPAVVRLADGTWRMFYKSFRPS